MKIKIQDIPDEIYVIQTPTPSLGDYTYLVVVGDEAAVIDPQLDLDRFDSLLAESGAHLRWVLDTHVHNDYVSGAKALSERHGSAYILPTGSGATFDHSVIRDADSIPLGRCLLRAIHTPGHTPHHMSYALELANENNFNKKTIAVFTGGSMLVGAVGRSDLLGSDLAEDLAFAQYRSVNQLAEELPNRATVGPTHGAGSFCSATPASEETVSTIGLEKTRNPALTAKSADLFVTEQLAGYAMFPKYYAHMGAINRGGKASSLLVSPPSLTPHEITEVAGKSVLVDLRDRQVFADGHIKGSINIPMSQDAAAYVGWVVPWNARLVLISDDQNDITNIVLHLHRIGISEISGTVSDGLAAWRTEGRPLSSYRVATFEDLIREHPTNILDARDPLEFRSFSIPTAVNVHFSQISTELFKVKPGIVWVHCQSGYRAAIAASQLAGAERDVVLVDDEIGNIEGPVRSQRSSRN